MTHDEIIHALSHLRPKAEYNVRGEAIEWLDSTTTKPSTQELQSTCKNCSPVKEAFANLTSNEEKIAFLAKRLGL